MSPQLHSTYGVSTFFLQSGNGNLYCNLYSHDAEPPATRSILFFPPFAEEMNKSRWIVAEQARRFATIGYDVLVPDLYGTGDSEGDFGDASWDVWCADIDRVVAWLRDRGTETVYFWGLRLGALLALECASKYQALLGGLLFWQPVLNGKNYLTQFLRLKVAADMLEANRKTTTRELREQLAADSGIEVAGYRIAPALALPIDRLEPKEINMQHLPGITWLEMLPGDDRPVPAMTRNHINELRETGLEIDFHSLVGEPFWSAQELVVVPELIEQTCRHFPKK